MPATVADRRQIFRELRNKKSVSQFKAATDLNITEGQFRNIETGRSNPSVRLMFRMISYFGTPGEELFPDLVEEDSDKCS
ncbi:XRE family transcriptional regulator [Sporolactobacillus shoreae]|uniref:XRE family transcriptional regulator n=1 Tax=Sporolactobacillus shoreae TaxID=1465501 RepID=A0A4Z0GIX9_9BACL|nr:helix-turn-helix transcriptional regulator [Sporolactobacillus shoreae]TGA96717.1 XRE family transcriptional regulator [Sporolactobacillus shoreae]